MNEIKQTKMRDLKPGDVVHVQGISCEIAELTQTNTR